MLFGIDKKSYPYIYLKNDRKTHDYERPQPKHPRRVSRKELLERRVSKKGQAGQNVSTSHPDDA
jgi:adenine-specific DNA methylase